MHTAVTHAISKLSNAVRPILAFRPVIPFDQVNSKSMKMEAPIENVDELLNDPSRHFNYNQILSQKKDGKIVLIDVREEDEIRENGILPDSINIPLAELTHALKDLNGTGFQERYNAAKPTRETPIVFSCKSGRRSLEALRVALELGYLRAGNYRGGWLDWQENVSKSQYTPQ